MGKNPNFEIYKKKLKEIEILYRKSGYRVNEIHADLESKKTLREFCGLYDPVIKSNFTSAGEHVPRAERNHRTIKERVRAAYYQLPYPRLPKLLVP